MLEATPPTAENKVVEPTVEVVKALLAPSEVTVVKIAEVVTGVDEPPAPPPTAVPFPAPPAPGVDEAAMALGAPVEVTPAAGKDC